MQIYGLSYIHMYRTRLLLYNESKASDLFSRYRDNLTKRPIIPWKVQVWEESSLTLLNSATHRVCGPAGGIWKQRFRFENASNFFRPHDVGGILKHNNHRPFWVCVRENLRQGNHRDTFFKKRRAAAIKLSWLEERFRKAPLSWRISVDGRPNHRNKTAFSNFFSVKWTLPNLIYKSQHVFLASSSTLSIAKTQFRPRSDDFYVYSQCRHGKLLCTNKT